MSFTDWREPFDDVAVLRNGHVVTLQRLLFGAGALQIWPYEGSGIALRATHFKDYAQAVAAFEVMTGRAL